MFTPGVLALLHFYTYKLHACTLLPSVEGGQDGDVRTGPRGATGRMVLARRGGPARLRLGLGGRLADRSARVQPLTLDPLPHLETITEIHKERTA